MTPDRALVVAGDRAVRERRCAQLRRAGYEALAFESCGEALDWLEEETPALAVIASREGQACRELLETLAARGVDLDAVGDEAALIGSG